MTSNDIISDGGGREGEAADAMGIPCYGIVGDGRRGVLIAVDTTTAIIRCYGVVSYDVVGNER